MISPSPPQPSLPNRNNFLRLRQENWTRPYLCHLVIWHTESRTTLSRQSFFNQGTAPAEHPPTQSRPQPRTDHISSWAVFATSSDAVKCFQSISPTDTKVTIKRDLQENHQVNTSSVFKNNHKPTCTTTNELPYTSFKQIPTLAQSEAPAPAPARQPRTSGTTVNVYHLLTYNY